MTHAVTTVVLADASRSMREQLAAEFVHAGFEVNTLADCKSVQDFFAKASAGVLVTELRLRDGPSMGLLDWMKRVHPEVLRIVLTGHGSVASAVQCLRLGVHGYLLKPVHFDRVLDALNGRAAGDEPLLGRPNSLDRALWEYINHAVIQAGSISEAARQLGLDRRSLRRMLGKSAPPPPR